MTYTPHVWSRHDKLDSLALNSLEQAVAEFSISQMSASDATIAPIITSGTQTVAAVNGTIDAHISSGASPAALKKGLPTDGSTAPGVDNTGVSECSAAIQAVLDANASGKDGPDSAKVVRLQGVFKIASTLIIKGSVDASNAVFNYSGTGTAVKVGDSSVGQLTRINVKLGQIICTTKQSGAVWPAGTVGLCVTNIFRSTFSYQQISNFETGLKQYGDGSYGQGGVAYNTFHCGTLNNNLVNQLMTLTTSTTVGFVNQNTHIGGSWAHSDGTYPVAGMRHITVGVTSGSVNNNLWLNASLEGGMEEYILDVFAGGNMWLLCRFEFGANPPPVRWGTTATNNIIFGGYGSDQLKETIAAGSPQVANAIIAPNSMAYNTTTDGGVVFSPAAGGTTSALTIMPGGWKASGFTTAANYVSRFQGTGIRLKVSSWTADGWAVDCGTRAMTLGSGIDTRANKIIWGSGSPEGAQTAAVGSTFYNYGAGTTGFGQYMKASGTGNTGWQAVGSQPFTTTARPTAATAGIGGTYYDTTLHKPGWSDGTTWRDATGAAM